MSNQNGSKYIEHLLRVADQCNARSEDSQDPDIKRYWTGRADSYISAVSLAKYYGVETKEDVQ